eukprot:4344763-Prymnesium_polylepis.1
MLVGKASLGAGVHQDRFCRTSGASIIGVRCHFEDPVGSSHHDLCEAEYYKLDLEARSKYTSIPAPEEGEFVPYKEMLHNLYDLVYVEHAAASRENDRQRIVADIRGGVGFEAVNRLARGSIRGARSCMEKRA